MQLPQSLLKREKRRAFWWCFGITSVGGEAAALSVCTKGRKRGNVTVSRNVYVSANKRPSGNKMSGLVINCMHSLILKCTPPSAPDSPTPGRLHQSQKRIRGKEGWHGPPLSFQRLFLSPFTLGTSSWPWSFL